MFGVHQFVVVTLSILFLPGVVVAQTGARDPKSAMERLEIELPDSVRSYFDVKRGIEELAREPCDKTAIINLGKALEKAGYRREAAHAHVRFSATCNGHPPSLRTAVNILLNLSDYKTAASVASKLIEAEPYHDNGYYLRAVAHLEGGEPRKAIDDFVTGIELFGNKDKIASIGYFNLSKSYEQLGQFCDAILPIEAWISLNPARNDNSQTRAMISALMAKGKCPAATGAEDVFPLTKQGNVFVLPATINSLRGTFLFDTGATYVSLKKAFAERAKVEVDENSSVRLNTANGVAFGKRGRAKLIQLKSLKAADVPIVVQAEAKGSYGEGVDGLLGMSLLSRFQIVMDGQTVRLKPRTGR